MMALAFDGAIQYADSKDDDGVPDTMPELSQPDVEQKRRSSSASLSRWVITAPVYVSGSEQTYWGTSQSNLWYQLSAMPKGVKGISFLPVMVVEQVRRDRARTGSRPLTSQCRSASLPVRDIAGTAPPIALTPRPRQPQQRR